MLQDYTVYTHLPEPLETLLLPGRRISAVSLDLQLSQLGTKAAAVGSPFGRSEGFWNPCNVAEARVRLPGPCLCGLPVKFWQRICMVVCELRAQLPWSKAVDGSSPSWSTVCFCHFHQRG